jgi:hypothetical protein
VTREPSIHWLAGLLTGDRYTVEEHLVQVTLAKMFLAWDRLEDRGSLDG